MERVLATTGIMLWTLSREREGLSEKRDLKRVRDRVGKLCGRTPEAEGTLDQQPQCALGPGNTQSLAGAE